MKLITELYDDIETQIIEEGAQKNLYINGVYMQSEVKNRNGRIYPRAVLENATKVYTETFINSKRAIGELNHPSSPQVNPERASHMITEIRQEGDNFIGKAKILRTPIGQTVRALIEDGVRMGVSSRGMGSIKESKGVSVVQNDFWLATVDIVADPSAPDAFVNGIMEGVEYYWDNGAIVERHVDQARQEVEQASRKNQLSEQRKFEIFSSFVDNLTTKT